MADIIYTFSVKYHASVFIASCMCKDTYFLTMYMNIISIDPVKIDSKFSDVN